MPAWVCYPKQRSHKPGYTGAKITLPVDLGGSLAVASRGLFATGVSTDLNGEGKAGIDRIINASSSLLT